MRCNASPCLDEESGLRQDVHLGACRGLHGPVKAIGCMPWLITLFERYGPVEALLEAISTMASATAFWDLAGDIPNCLTLFRLCRHTRKLPDPFGTSPARPQTA